MNAPILKFCGLTRPEDVAAAITYGARYLGFIVECNSPRRLSVERAAMLSSPAQGLARRVAVLVDPDNGLIDRVRDQMAPDFIQLHGKETPKRVQAIKNRAKTGIIKALSIRTKADLDRATSYEGIVDALLFDAKPPKGAAQRGGHGLVFDWSLLKGFKSSLPIFLAGGLGPENIAKARRQTGVKIFDVSSGIETRPGIKDPELMAQFIKAARNE